MSWPFSRSPCLHYQNEPRGREKRFPCSPSRPQTLVVESRFHCRSLRSCSCLTGGNRACLAIGWFGIIGLLSAKAKETGIRAGDIILGLDDKTLEMDVDGFQRFVERNYLIGDRVTINLLRDGKRLSLPMTLGR